MFKETEGTDDFGLTFFRLNGALLFVLYRTEYDKYSEDPEFKPAARHAKDLFEEVKICYVTLY